MDDQEFSITDLVEIQKNINTNPIKIDFGFNDIPTIEQNITLKRFVNDLKEKFGMNMISKKLLIKSIRFRDRHKFNSAHKNDNFTIDDLVLQIRGVIGSMRFQKLVTRLHEFYIGIPEKYNKQKLIVKEDYDPSFEPMYKVISYITEFYNGSKPIIDDLEKLIYSCHIFSNNDSIGETDFLYDILDIYLSLMIDYVSPNSQSL